MKKVNIPKKVLYKKYIKELKTPYKIAEELGVNHKTVRAYLRKHNVPLRTASEYNFLAKQNYTKPSKKSLLCKKSIAAHIAYICEGWHTEKSNHISFSNQDPALIDLVVWCLKEIYKAKSVSIKICARTKSQCTDLLDIYPNASFVRDRSRKNPIVRAVSGGKMLVRDFVQNSYNILSSFE